jgi:alkanesulfonate monooxygenase SsuD/methylene tetrahydromethanopterin reductase-like flavin-dependent oxidoreductase (luciferase family)
VKAWTSNGPFSYEGKFWKLEDYTFFPKPIQQPHPPIYALGVITPESCLWTGKQGFHLATGFFVPIQERVRIMKLAWDAISTEFGGRQFMYEWFFAGDPINNRLVYYGTERRKECTALAQRLLDALKS